jgi:hypothetical protein
MKFVDIASGMVFFNGQGHTMNQMHINLFFVRRKSKLTATIQPLVVKNGFLIWSSNLTVTRNQWILEFRDAWEASDGVRRDVVKLACREEL